MNDRLRKSWRWLRRSGALSLVIVVLVSLSFRSAIADWNDVPSGSMKPTILIGDRIFVNKLAYDLRVPFTSLRLASWADPQRGDIVICWSPVDGTRLVKRVAAVPGDTVAMENGRLSINGKPLAYAPADAEAVAAVMGTDAEGKVFYTEDLTGVQHVVAFEPARRGFKNFRTITVPEGQYFMLGDNRDNSADSRYFGFVPRGDIVGRATAVAVSLDYDDHFRPRWSRFFSKLI